MRRKSHKAHTGHKHRDLLDDLETESAPRLGRPIPPIRLGAPVHRLPEVEDRRNWAPDRPFPKVPVRVVSGARAPISHQPKTTPNRSRTGGGKLTGRGSVTAALLNASARFAAPRQTVICLKRQVRREVLHAFKRTRSGGPKHRNAWSAVSCS